MKLFFPLIFFVLTKKPWVNMVSVKSIVVNKVREHVNNSLTNFPSFPANGKFVLPDHPFTLNDKNIEHHSQKKGLYAR
jgi:hypothetical protein